MAGDYERGYYLLDPNKGDTLYRDVVRKSEETLGLEAQEVIEQAFLSGRVRGAIFPVGPAWVPWAAQEVQNPHRICLIGILHGGL